MSESTLLRKSAWEILDLLRDRSINEKELRKIADRMLQRANNLGPLSRTKQDKINFE